MLSTFLYVMGITTIVVFLWMFFFGKVKVNGIITNSIFYQFIGSLLFTFMIDSILFCPVGIIIIMIFK